MSLQDLGRAFERGFQHKGEFNLAKNDLEQVLQKDEFGQLTANYGLDFKYYAPVVFRSSTTRDRAISYEGSEKRLALVIGNSDYQHSGSLLNPVNDASDMAAMLQQLGFDVISLTNAGLYSEEDVEYNCVAAGRVLAKMEAAENRMNIVILDACRDNPFERSWSRGSGSRGLARMDAPTGSIIAYATEPGNTASDGTGRNGLYTQALLEEMQSSGIIIERLFRQVRTKVIERSGKKQTPWESTSLTGDFYFIPPEEY